MKRLCTVNGFGQSNLRMLFGIIAVLLGLTTTLVIVPNALGEITVYDAFADFSPTSNPTQGGTWRHGYTVGLGGPLSLYTVTSNKLGLSVWLTPYNVDPNVIKNGTGQEIVEYGAILYPTTEFLYFHPGPNCEFSVIRWTAPVSGTYQITSSFKSLRFADPPTTTDVHVLYNSTPLFNGLVNGYISSGSQDFSTTLVLNPNATIDFVVGCGANGNHGFDSTGVKASIAIADLQVSIDIKPGSLPNSINPQSNGMIPVAILTTGTFDPATVDPLTVKFGPNGAVETHGRGHFEDVDGDGDLDLVFHFTAQDTGITCGDTSASLTGKTFGGQAIKGSDSVNTAGCE